MQRDRQSAEPHGRPSAAASAASRSRPSSASVELIRFARPKPGVNLLTIRGFSPNTSPEKLHQIFSECGLIDNLVIYKSDDRSRGGAPPTMAGLWSQAGGPPPAHSAQM